MNSEMMLSSVFWMDMGTKALRIMAILVGAGILNQVIQRMTDKFLLSHKGGMRSLYLEEKRARTINGLVKSILRYGVYFFAGIMVLQEVHIDTSHLVAGAGIIGLALGVGAQNLIKDFVTGFFIIMEDQYTVGDYVVCGDMAGTVESLEFRVTRLRDANGVLHIIPNGSITRISNYSRGSMQAVINIPVSYKSDMERIMVLLTEIGDNLVGEVAEMLEKPQILGIVEMRAEEMIVRVIAKTIPLEQGKVETAFRYKVHQVFSREGISLPVYREWKEVKE